MTNPVMTPDELLAYLHEVMPQADTAALSIKRLSTGEIDVRLAVTDRHLRPGGTVSGPALMALADVTTYMLILAHIGRVPLAVTTSLNINFMRKPGPGDVSARARLLKLGKRLAVVEVGLFGTGDADLAAHATVTYSIPDRE